MLMHTTRLAAWSYRMTHTSTTCTVHSPGGVKVLWWACIRTKSWSLHKPAKNTNKNHMLRWKKPTHIKFRSSILNSLLSNQRAAACQLRGCCSQRPWTASRSAAAGSVTNKNNDSFILQEYNFGVRGKRSKRLYHHFREKCIGMKWTIMFRVDKILSLFE